MRFILITYLLCLLTSTGKLPARAFLDSSYLVRGEVTTLTIESTRELKKIPETLYTSEDYTIKRTDAYTSRNGYDLLYNYKFSLTSFHLGNYVIPSLNLQFTDGESFLCNPVEFEVKPSSALSFKEIKIGDEDVSYAVALFLPERDLYLGETVRAELKVYLPFRPSLFSVVDYGVPEHKRDGISAWRFQSDRRSRINSFNPFLLPQGPSFAITYKSSAHAMQTGTVSLGPGDIRPVFKAITNRNGFPSYLDQPIHLPIEKLERKALPLPPGAPESFKGAVGQFTLGVDLENQVRNSPSDPITALLTVSGTGNLDKIEAPVPLTSDTDWKLYPATKKQREAERRFLSGTVEFNQILRPTSDQRDLPAFQFSYFNPVEKKYVTEESAPIPLLIQAQGDPSLTQKEDKKKTADALPPIGEITLGEGEKAVSGMRNLPPEESMAGVLGLLSPPYDFSVQSTPLWKYWQLIPALLAVLLLLKVFSQFLLPALRPTPEKRKMKEALRDLKGTTETIPFLKKASQFSHHFLGKEEFQDLRSEVDGLRDEHCYQPAEESPVLGNLREQLLQKLTKATKTALPLLLLTFLLLPEGHAETTPEAETILEKAYSLSQQEDYSAALSLFLSAYPEKDYPADISYNIGCCYAQLEEPGLAMLFFRRTLLKSPDHQEAQQNVRYLEKFHGSNVIYRTGLSKYLSLLTRTTLKTILYALIWIMIISALCLLLFQKRRAHFTSWAVFLLAGFLLPFSICSLLFYPTDGKFAPASETVVVTNAKTSIARTNASNTANQVIKIPPGSIAKIIAQRGLWAYLEFANSTRGWVNTKDLEMLLPSASFTPVTPVEETPDL